MTTEQQIDQQLNDEYNKFMNSKYEGKVEVPENFIDVFKKSVMALAPQFHQININKLHVIANTNDEDLTIDHIHAANKMILNTPFEKIYDNFYEAMESHSKIQKFIVCYNKVVDDFSEKLKMKKATLQSLSSPSLNGNSMRIIN